ncbi:hypothetical protein [Streptomyces sp. NRRL F-5053]|uniref:hypothetical protein n=1 Tax=Streptomyces sp. NRRL F-5053 TaxID=1463854 RepID=UPI0004CB40DE|nr:hypothetical protein [Streptomyces sp. NRRL F-5053]
MTSLFAALGAKAADRWVQVLLLPGLFFTAAVAVGLLAGQRRALDLPYLAAELNDLATRSAAHSALVGVLVAVGVSLASAAAGLLADVLGSAVQWCWTWPSHQPPARWLLRRRRKRWRTAADRLRAAIRAGALPPGGSLEESHHERRIALLRRRLHRIGPAWPTRPTRIAERFGATARRTEELYGLTDLHLVWPRLHAVVPEPLQATLASARADYAASARLTGWGVMYTAAASLWWPAAIVASAAFLACRIRAKPTADRLADVVDTAIDLHLTDLAEKLGADCPDDVRLLGTRILERLRPTP